MNKEIIYILRGDGFLLDGGEKFSLPLKSASLTPSRVFRYETFDGRIIKATTREMFGEKYKIDPINLDQQISLANKGSYYHLTVLDIAFKN